MRKRTYKLIAPSTSLRYSLWQYTKITPSPAFKFQNDPDKFKIIPHKKKQALEKPATSKIDDAANYCESLTGNELEAILTSIKDKYRKEGIKEGIRECTKKMRGYIPSVELTEDRFKFDSTQEPHSAFNIFAKCVKNGFYPPPEVLTFISDHLDQYLNSDKTLDSVFGLSKRSRNAYLNNHRNIHIIVEIDTLRHHFGIDVEDAIGAVFRRHEGTDTSLTETTIRDIYYREGKKQLEAGLMSLHQDIYCIEVFDDEEERSDFLESILLQYPHDVIDYLRNRYSTIRPLLSSPIEKLESAKPDE